MKLKPFRISLSFEKFSLLEIYLERLQISIIINILFFYPFRVLFVYDYNYFNDEYAVMNTYY